MKILFVFAMMASFLFGAIDINTASAKELSTLKGVGMKKAEVIVAFRDGHCFKSVDELSMVKGIGVKTVEKNKANLKVSACKR